VIPQPGYGPGGGAADAFFVIDELSTLTLMRARDQGRALLATVRRAMVEVEYPARLALVCLLADGHLLIEDVPGVGKTTLARIIARAIGGHDSRIQCTADLSPADIIGVETKSDNPAIRPDVFDPGPLFANAVVIDEINRGAARLQAALFEAMEERCVTVAKRRHPLPRPFFVVGTMNPHDVDDHTVRLAHGQRDRFAICTGIGYPSQRGEFDLLDRFGAYDAVADIDPIVAPGDVVKVQRSVGLVDVSDAVRDYIVRLVRSTREHDAVAVGASPRAALSLQRCCQALALLENCTEVEPQHVDELFAPCLAHRMQYRDAATDAAAVCRDVIEQATGPAWQRAVLRPVDTFDEDDEAYEVNESPVSADLPGVSRLQRRLEAQIRGDDPPFELGQAVAGA
jgi:MoxR-like ATPase